MKRFSSFTAVVVLSLVAAPAYCITLDGMNIPSEGLPLLATQDSATAFGDSTGGTQASTGGSELNQMFSAINSGVLELGVTGNLEGNFNKLWFFFDAVDGGENVLANDNADGGFGEINAMAGLTFPTGVTMDHGLRLEIGGGFHGVRFFDLITNTGQDIMTGGGAADLPLSDQGGAKGVTFGWDNSNVLGVTDADAAGANTATAGFEFEIDLAAAFNGSQGDINIAAFVTSSDSTFASNQFLPAVGSAENLGSLAAYSLQTVATVTGPPIMGAMPGDVDGDGDVDLEEAAMDGDGVSDFDIIRMNWLETNATFGMNLVRTDGDLNENGTVGIEDFREWKNAFGGSGAQVAAALRLLNGDAVPEPGTALLALLAGCCVVAVRRMSSRGIDNRS